MKSPKFDICGVRATGQTVEDKNGKTVGTVGRDENGNTILMVQGNVTVSVDDCLVVCRPVQLEAAEQDAAAQDAVIAGDWAAAGWPGDGVDDTGDVTKQ